MNSSFSITVTALFAFSFAGLFHDTACAQSRNVFLVICADKDDPDIGQDVTSDCIRINSILTNGFGSESTRLITSTVSANQSKSALVRQIGETVGLATPNDAVVFYYSGHAEIRANAGHGLLLSRRSDFLARSELKSMLLSRSPALVVMLTDSCAKKRGPEPFAAAAPFVSDPMKPLMKKLLFDSYGVVDVNSCQEGQSAFSSNDLHPGSDQRIFGGLFTNSFIEVISNNLDRAVDWQSILMTTSVATTQAFKRCYPDGEFDEFTNKRQRSQTPLIYECSVEYKESENQPMISPLPNNPAKKVPLGVTLRTCKDGVHVDSVKAGTPAQKCIDINNRQSGIAIEADDHILEINGIAVSRHEDAVRLISNSGIQLRITVKDGKSGQVFQLETDLSE